MHSTPAICSLMSNDPFGMASDEELVSALQSEAGTSAMAELWIRYRPKILATCRRTLRDPATAEDISQETFLRAITKIGEFEPGNFPGWLQTIARNLCINHLQKASTRHERT